MTNGDQGDLSGRTPGDGTGTHGEPGASCGYTVHILQCGDEYVCMNQESLLKGMARLGRKSIPVGCLNGGCGVCKVAIRKGSFCKIGVMSRAHVSEEEESRGIVLACRVAPACDIELDVLGKMQKSVLGIKGLDGSR